MPSIIKSFHDGMKAEVRVGGGQTTDSITVKNGLWQGCTLAPSLFNLYFNAMVACWRSKCPQAGVNARYKHGRKLVSDCIAKSRLQEVRITVAVYATT